MTTAERQSGGPLRPLVAFDFDGTLTWRDSFRAFLRWRTGSLGYALGMARLAPGAMSYLLDRDRGRLKGGLIDAFLLGLSRADLESQARKFADSQSPALLRPDALARWNLWRERGARLIIVTATPETVVAPFAETLGACRLIGSRLAFDELERVTGMQGANCRGAEKVKRLREEFGGSVRLDAAYGDSDGDIEMLALADESGFRQFRLRP